jgi:nicotinamide phosphoribosyltransferase
MDNNLILMTDSYKLSHFLGYPKDTDYIYGYMESRGGEYTDLVFAGLQGMLKKYFSKRVTMKHVKKAAAFSKKHGLPFNEEGWTDIAVRFNGWLPLEVKAIPEGTVIGQRQVMMTFVNTVPGFHWLESHCEDLFMQLWYPITVASRIYGMKKRIKPFFDRTSDAGNMDFALLDFSLRGCSSMESAMVGGAAYLIHFLGSDNIPAVNYVNEYYNSEMSGFSVPATEHSIMCAYRPGNELASFDNLIENMAQENGILSVVSDTWNIYEACEKWVSLKEKIFNKNITLVVRPDSGEMEEVLPKVFKTLSAGFGVTVNANGYAVMRNVKVLQGDGIDEHTVVKPFEIAESLSISADSVITGSGGGLMQKNIDRDTAKFAIKASEVTIDGVRYPIAKDPITDHGKKSKEGRMKLEYTPEEGYQTVLDCNPDYDGVHDMLRTVYYNGAIAVNDSIDTIRERIKL